MDLETLTCEIKGLVYSYLNQVKAAEDGRIGSWLDGFGEKDFGSFPLSSYMYKIGNMRIKNPVVSAPLAGISDNTFRIFAKFFGCGLTYSEMITSFGLFYNHKKSMSMAQITELERPCAVQIFGSESDVMAEAAARTEGIADMIDINMGCPVPKVLKSGSGGCLLKDIGKAERIIKAVVSNVGLPVTAKIRLGWDWQSINALDMAYAAEAAGAKAIAIHGRTVRQGFSGTADYSYIKKVKERVSIPVIASGDIKSPHTARDVLKYTGCDAIMVGRAAKGSMWLFLDIILGFLGSYKGSAPDLQWRKKFALAYFNTMIYFKGEEKASREFRKYLSWIFKGQRGISRVKKNFFTIRSFEDAAVILDDIKRDVAQPG